MPAALQNITMFAELAALIAVDEATLRRFSYGMADGAKYKMRPFKKRNGTERFLAIPHSTLKMIQRRLLILLEEVYRPSSRAFAYIKGRGIRGNAAPHVRHRLMFTVDIKDFFDQINFGRIRGRLMAPPYKLSNSVATAIAKLTTCHGRLPFGAPTSPILSNMIFSGLDAALTKLGRDTGSFYTRYADDITFSTQKSRFAPQIARLIEEEGVRSVAPGTELEKLIEDGGFHLNPAKTRLKTRQDSQIICGVLCNEKLNVRRSLRREIRALLHAWEKFGTGAVQELWVTKFGNGPETHFERSLRGKISFMCQIRGDNDLVSWSAVESFNQLTSGDKIPYDKPVDWREGVRRSVCVIYAESADVNLSTAVSRQGSGFVIGDGFIITNNHVACYSNGAAVEKLSVQFHGLMLGSLNAEVVAQSADLDIALLRLTSPGLAAALMSDRAIPLQFGAQYDTGTTVTLAGYPNYQDGDTLHLAEGHITGHSALNGLGVFKISASVIYGNSGGPILNEKGAVVGVAVCGSGINDAPYTVHNGAIPSTALKDWLETALAHVTLA